MYKKLVFLILVTVFCFGLISSALAFDCAGDDLKCPVGQKCFGNECKPGKTGVDSCTRSTQCEDGGCVAGLCTKGTFGLSNTASAAGYVQGDWTVIVSKVISIFLSLVSVIFFAMAMYAGLRWLTARGNDELSGKARNALIAAISGMIVVVLSWAVTLFVIGKLQQQSSVPGGGVGTECCCANVGTATEKDFQCLTNIDQAHCAAASADVREAEWTFQNVCDLKASGDDYRDQGYNHDPQIGNEPNSNAAYKACQEKMKTDDRAFWQESSLTCETRYW